MGRVDRFKQALYTRGRVGMAIGIVMERYDLDDQEARTALTHISHISNLRLAAIAEEIVTSRVVPAAPGLVVDEATST